MDRRISKNSAEERLFEARKTGLQKVSKVETMCAHGKILGMDTFSWVAPQVDKLATVIHSFPFKVLWIGSRDHIKLCLENYPELANSIETIIIYDQPNHDMNIEFLQRIKDYVCVEGTSAALELAKSLNMKKRVFLFTINKAEAQEQKLKFEQFISLFN
jgi:hypothetical protein